MGGVTVIVGYEAITIDSEVQSDSVILLSTMQPTVASEIELSLKSPGL